MGGGTGPSKLRGCLLCLSLFLGTGLVLAMRRFVKCYKRCTKGSSTWDVSPRRNRLSLFPTPPPSNALFGYWSRCVLAPRVLCVLLLSDHGDTLPFWLLLPSSFSQRVLVCACLALVLCTSAYQRTTFGNDCTW